MSNNSTTLGSQIVNTPPPPPDTRINRLNPQPTPSLPQRALINPSSISPNFISWKRKTSILFEIIVSSTKRHLSSLPIPLIFHKRIFIKKLVVSYPLPQLLLQSFNGSYGSTPPPFYSIAWIFSKHLILAFPCQPPLAYRSKSEWNWLSYCCILIGTTTIFLWWKI